MPQPTLHPESARWMESALSRLSAAPPAVNTSRGVRYYSPRAWVSDGVVMELNAAQLDGKGAVTDTFVPKRGPVSTVPDPAQPVTSPRRSTPVRVGVGLSLAFMEALTGWTAVALVTLKQQAAAEEGAAKQKADDDASIVECIFAAAKAAASGVGRRVTTDTLTKRAPRASRRGKVWAYSRKRP